MMGEFGRTPKTKHRWRSRSLAKGIQRIARRWWCSGRSSDRQQRLRGESPKDRPVTPADLAATIYTLMGIDPKLELHTSDGRPVRVAPFEAEVVSELVG